MKKIYTFFAASILSLSSLYSWAACPPIKTSISETICKGDFYSTTKNTYNASGTYFDTLKLSLGCDSIVEIKLSVHEVKKQGVVTQNICAGDSIFWSGKFRKTAGEYSEISGNMYGCDSTTILKLTVNKSPLKDTSIHYCNGNSFSDDSYYFDKTGKYTLVYKTKTDCDSIVHLDLKIAPTYFKTVNISICENTFNQIGRLLVSDAGIYYDSLKTNKYGCDSVFEYNVRVIIPPAKPEIKIKLPDTLYTLEEGSKYVWFIDKMKLTANTKRIKAPKNGSYKVVVYKEDKCPSDTSDIFVVNTLITSIEKETTKEEVFIYPNPGQNHIILQGKNTLGKIQLIDFTGKIAGEYYTNENKLEIETTDLKAGKYLIKLNGGNKKIQILH